MTPQRQIRVVKKSAEKTSLPSQKGDMMRDEELLRRWQEFRRAYLAFEAFLKSSGLWKPE